MCGWPNVLNLVPAQPLSEPTAKHHQSFLISDVAARVDSWIAEISAKPQLMQMCAFKKEALTNSSPVEALNLRLRLIILVLATSTLYTEVKNLNASALSTHCDCFKHHKSCLGQIFASSACTMAEEFLQVESNGNFCGAAARSANIGEIFWASFFGGPVTTTSTCIEASLALMNTATSRTFGNGNRKKDNTKKSRAKTGIPKGQQEVRNPAAATNCSDGSTAPQLINYFPTIVFPCSFDLLSYPTPWDCLSPLSQQTITIGVHIQLFASIFRQWNSKPIKTLSKQM